MGEVILAVLNSRAATYAPGTTLFGVGAYVLGGDVRQVMLACLFGPASVEGGKVLAEWVRLLEPNKRRRPRRRGG